MREAYFPVDCAIEGATPRSESLIGSLERDASADEPGGFWKGGEDVVAEYRCEKCGHTSSTPGECCGAPMRKMK